MTSQMLNRVTRYRTHLHKRWDHAWKLLWLIWYIRIRRSPFLYYCNLAYVDIAYVDIAYVATLQDHHFEIFTLFILPFSITMPASLHEPTHRPITHSRPYQIVGMIKWGWGSLMQIFVGGRNSAFPRPSSPPVAPSIIESRRAMDVVRKVEDGDS